MHVLEPRERICGRWRGQWNFVGGEEIERGEKDKRIREREREKGGRRVGEREQKAVHVEISQWERGFSP